MVLKSENARVLAKLFAKQKIAESLKGRLLLIVKLCFKIAPVNIDHHRCILLSKHTVGEFDLCVSIRSVDGPERGSLVFTITVADCDWGPGTQSHGLTIRGSNYKTAQLLD